MRNPWQGGASSRRGRYKSDDRPGTTPSGSPYDFSVDHDEQVDPVDLLAIRADDELLDALAAGRPVGPHLLTGLDRQLDSGYTDDQQVLAMLQALRADVDSDPFPELVSVEDASKAIVAGQRAARPKRRLMPVATAAAVVVLAMSGVAIGASNAQPGDPLWGVSTVLDGNRANSVEAAYRVTAALSAAQQALAEGRTADAKAALARVQPDLNKVTDQQRKEELSRKSANLTETVETSPEGERVDTDENGSRRDQNRDRDRRQQGGQGNSGSSSSSADPGGSTSSPNPSGNDPSYNPRSGQPGFPGLPGQPSTDPRRGGAGPGQQSQRPEPQDPRRAESPEATNPSTGSPSPAPQSPKPAPESPRPRPESPNPAPETTRPAPETTRPAPETTRPAPETTRPAPESRPAGTRPAPDTRPATETTHTTKPSPEESRPRTRPPTEGGGRGDAGGGANNNRGNNTGSNGHGGTGEQRHQGTDNTRTQPRGGGGGHTEGAPDQTRGVRPTGAAPAVMGPVVAPGAPGAAGAAGAAGAGGIARPQPTS